MCLPFRHQWKISERHASNIFESHRREDSLPVSTYIVFVMECMKCGWISRKKVRT